jgi:hypothetical protein
MLVKLRALQAEKDNGQVVKKTNLAVGDWLDHWLDHRMSRIKVEWSRRMAGHGTTLGLPDVVGILGEAR